MISGSKTQKLYSGKNIPKNGLLWKIYTEMELFFNYYGRKVNKTINFQYLTLVKYIILLL